MARIRTVKPEFFLHEGLFDLEQETGWPMRIAYQGLWCQADKEGRFPWQPRKLKTQICPYDEIDFSRVLDALATRGFVIKYACSGVVLGAIPSFKTHQFINNKEPESSLPSYDASECEVVTCTREAREADALGTRSYKERKGKEGKDIPPKSPKGDRARFTPPSIEDVKAYCLERNKGVDPEAWFDHYTSNGWKVGPNKMRDWKAAVRQWERSSFRAAGKSGEFKQEAATAEDLANWRPQ